MQYDINTHIATLYFDRNTSTIEGKVTLKILNKETNEVIQEVVRLQARSGQNGYTNTSWTTGKSPIPFGKHILWLDRTLQKGQWAIGKGIGEFYPISSSTANSDVIVDPANPKNIRRAVGLHPENAYAGSAGCIVLVADTQTKKNDILKLRTELLLLHKAGFKNIPLVVL
jgi:hypothetical protein